MYTYTLYEVERPRSIREQRELNTINGELALAIRRPFRRLKAGRHPARPVTRRWPRNDGQPVLRARALGHETAIPQVSRCS